MKKLNLNFLETFFAVYKLRSYTKAASYLGCTPSNVRQKLQRLEAETGESYFVKKNKMLLPTSSAETLYSKTYSHFHSLELQVGSIRTHQSKQHIDILTSTGASMLWTTDLVNNFMKSHGGFSFSIHTTESRGVDLVDSYDIFVLPQQIEHSNYIRTTAGSFSTHLFASQDYLDHYGTPKTPEDLDHHRLISFYHKADSYRGDTDWSLRIGRPLSDPRNPSLIINNMLGISHAVVKGMGISALTLNNPFIKSHNLVPVLPDFSGPAVTVYLFYNTLLGNNEFIRYIEHKDFQRLAEKMVSNR